MVKIERVHCHRNIFFVFSLPSSLETQEQYLFFYNLLCGYICPFRTTFQPETGAARGNIFSSQPAPVTFQYYYNPKNMQEEVWIHARERKTILKNKRKTKRNTGISRSKKKRAASCPANLSGIQESTASCQEPRPLIQTAASWQAFRFLVQKTTASLQAFIPQIYRTTASCQANNPLIWKSVFMCGK